MWFQIKAVRDFCTCLFIFAAAGALVAGDLPDNAALGIQIDRIVAPYVAARDFMGVVGVQRDGEAPLIRAYGLASVELAVPHQPNDIFMIGSVSKHFTAVAILLLEEQGLLGTADTLSKYLADFEHGKQITIEQLLTHTSVVADIYSLKKFW